MIYCLFAAGVVFGFAAIKPVLLEEGVYRNQCTQEELEDDVLVCYGQELRLNLMFTIAAVSTNVVALPVGTILDRYGPRVSGLIGALFITIGSLLFAFAGDIPGDAYIPGYLFLALGGPFTFISSFQLSNTFPQYSGLILALLTGAFDTSSAVFLVYRLIYQGTNGAFTPKKFFLVYLVVPAYIFLVQIFFMPATSYKTVGELAQTVETTTNDVIHDSDDEIEDNRLVRQLQDARRVHRDSIVSQITDLLGTKDATDQTKEEAKKKNISGVWGALHGKTAAEQIRTPWFILITLFTVLQMLRINYFVATIRSQYTYLFRSAAAAEEINNFFDVALPVGGVLSVPFIGLLLDNTSTTFCMSMLVTIATAIGVLGIIPERWAAYANICLFVVYRPLYYTAVSYASLLSPSFLLIQLTFFFTATTPPKSSASPPSARSTASSSASPASSTSPSPASTPRPTSRLAATPCPSTSFCWALRCWSGSRSWGSSRGRVRRLGGRGWRRRRRARGRG